MASYTKRQRSSHRLIECHLRSSNDSAYEKVYSNIIILCELSAVDKVGRGLSSVLAGDWLMRNASSTDTILRSDPAQSHTLLSATGNAMTIYKEAKDAH